MCFRPSSKGVFGVHFNSDWALLMSGLRFMGSFSGKGLLVIVDLDSVSARIVSASCCIVISVGLPMFKGPGSFWVLCSVKARIASSVSW